MSFKAKFQSSQIVYLECQKTRLYAEVIQIVEDRQLAWVRPIALVDASGLVDDLSKSDDRHLDNQPLLYDLREGADLLCPTSLFQAALDTQVIPILTELEISKAEMTRHQAAFSQTVPQPSALHHLLRAFIQNVWQTHPEAFQP
ncbi:MAG: hypothetical protein KME15_01475 [Drouetiella hepatica Uher 2000/2452]|jgi:hypothetical protein|uniref:Uncharacterized protein n=1 Tax=Drouetiella hepatica Uher 2000/2452 TaxID=904376 RepID=A0A951Q6L4_9CYAN|nr:hypothetical protein [Drouetiella hepatica Uher 2000/2452]